MIHTFQRRHGCSDTKMEDSNVRGCVLVSLVSLKEGVVLVQR